jgi:hypothetical protein
VRRFFCAAFLLCPQGQRDTAKRDDERDDLAQAKGFMQDRCGEATNATHEMIVSSDTRTSRSRMLRGTARL